MTVPRITDIYRDRASDLILTSNSDVSYRRHARIEALADALDAFAPEVIGSALGQAYADAANNGGLIEEFLLEAVHRAVASLTAAAGTHTSPAPPEA